MFESSTELSNNHKRKCACAGKKWTERISVVRSVSIHALTFHSRLTEYQIDFRKHRKNWEEKNISCFLVAVQWLQLHTTKTRKECAKHSIQPFRHDKRRALSNCLRISLRCACPFPLIVLFCFVKRAQAFASNSEINDSTNYQRRAREIKI